MFKFASEKTDANCCIGYLIDLSLWLDNGSDNSYAIVFLLHKKNYNSLTIIIECGTDLLLSLSKKKKTIKFSALFCAIFFNIYRKMSCNHFAEDVKNSSGSALEIF